MSEYQQYLGSLLQSGEYACFAEPSLPCFSFEEHHRQREYKAISARDPECIRRWLEDLVGVQGVQEEFDVPF